MVTPTVEETTTPPVDPKAKPARDARRRWILGGIALILILAGLGAYFGYQSGIDVRLSYRSTEVASKVMEQYTLGLRDVAEGRLLVARQRFEAVIQMDPSFPGAADRLTEVMLALSVTNTPTPAPTPTVTPTPDLRGAEELFNQVQQYLVDENWQAAIDTLDTLRKENRDYHTIDVDGMYFIALRNRGMRKISEGSLEMGMYDLSLAERFGYLDGQAIGLRNITRLYLTGASFWEIDWKQASYFFSEVYPYYPGLRDASGRTARDRYREATLKYADALAAAGDVCGAQAQYEAVMQLGMDPTVQPTLDNVRNACSGPQSPPEGPVEQTPTVPAGTTTPPVSGETPTVEVTPEPGTTSVPTEGVQETPNP